MIFSWILVVAFLIITIIGTIFWCIDKFSKIYVAGELWYILFTVIGGLIAFLLIIICLTSSVCCKKEIHQFQQQKAYIEALDDSEHNYAITIKKAELNEWLYGAQYSYENYRIFTFYNKSIMDLEEIE